MVDEKFKQGKQIRAVILFADIMNASEISNNATVEDYAKILFQFHSCATKIIEFLKLDIYKDKIYEMDKRGDQVCLILHSYSMKGEESETDVLKRDVSNAVLFAIAIKLLWRASEYNQKRIEQDLFPRDLGIGIHEGLVYYSGTSEGYSINLSKRIETESRNGEFSKILASGSVKYWGEAANFPARFVPHKIIEEIKGISTNFCVYEIQKIDTKIFEYINNLAKEFEFSDMTWEQYRKLFDKNPDDYWTELLLRFKSSYLKADVNEMDMLGIKNETKSQSAEKNIMFFMTEASRYLNTGNYSMAIENFTKVIELDPKNIVAYNNRGAAYDKNGSIDKAIDDFSNILLHYPNDARAYYNRGLMYSKNGLFDKSIEDFTKALKIDPKYANAIASRGVSYAKKGILDKAIEDFSSAIVLDPKAYISYNNRGNIYMQQGKEELALLDYANSIKIMPSYILTYINRANYYSSKNQYDKALQDLQKAINIDPNFPSAYNNRGIIFYKIKKYSEAMTDYRKSIELEANALTYSNRGFLYIDLNQMQAAKNDFNKALSIEEDHADSYCGLAICNYLEGKENDAKDFYNKAISCDKDYGDTVEKLLKSGKYYSEKQIDIMNKLIEISKK